MSQNDPASIPASRFEVGTMMNGAGQMWKVGIDPITFKHYWVPSAIRLVRDDAIGSKKHQKVATIFKEQEKYNESTAKRARFFAIPTALKNRHLWLPRRRRKVDQPKPIPEIQTLLSPEDRKKGCKLKHETKAYQRQKEKYLEAKKVFEKAKEDMDRYMGIIPLSELKKIQHSLLTSKTKCQEALLKEESINIDLARAQQQLRDRQRQDQMARARLQTAQHNRDSLTCNQLIADIKNNHGQLQSQQRHIIQLQKQLNAVKMARTQLEKLYKLHEKDFRKLRNTRRQYRGEEDLADAKKAVLNAQRQVDYFQKKEEKLNKAIEDCKKIIDGGKGKYKFAGGAMGMSDNDTDLLINELNTMNTRFTEQQERERYDFAVGTKEIAERELKEVKHQLREAEGDFQTAQQYLDELIKDSAFDVDDSSGKSTSSSLKSPSDFNQLANKIFITKDNQLMKTTNTNKVFDKNKTHVFFRKNDCRGIWANLSRIIGTAMVPTLMDKLVEVGYFVNGKLDTGFLLVSAGASVFYDKGRPTFLMYGARKDNVLSGEAVGWRIDDIKLKKDFSMDELRLAAQQMFRKPDIAGNFINGSLVSDMNDPGPTEAAANGFRARFPQFDDLGYENMEEKTIFLLAIMVWTKFGDQGIEKLDKAFYRNGKLLYAKLLELIKCTLKTATAKLRETTIEPATNTNTNKTATAKLREKTIKKANTNTNTNKTQEVNPFDEFDGYETAEEDLDEEVSSTNEPLDVEQENNWDELADTLDSASDLFGMGGGQNTHTQFQQLMSDWQSFADRRVLAGGDKPATARDLAERYQTLLNQMDQVRRMLNTNLQQLVDNADKFDLKQMKEIAGGINNRRQKMKHKLGPMESFLRRDQRKIGDKKVTRLIQQRIDEIKRAL